MPEILLATLNARYFHASLGLRYLYANLGELREQAEIVEFVINQKPADLAEQLLARKPRIIGLGVYIWNVAQTLELVAVIKTVAPEVTLILGGPEVSHEIEGQSIVAWADHVIAGQGDLAFAELCRQVLAGTPPSEKILRPEPPPLDEVELPYRHYTDEDIRNRFIYVEASRGCPFKCEFCLSALDKTATPFDQDRFLAEMDLLHRRGVRHFKFVDRTFNLNIKASTRILEFFLERLDEKLFLHFEVVPDHLPEALKAVIRRFPPGHLQFEVGIQTFNPAVQTAISRRQDNDKAAANLRWLREHSPAHIHADLIIGLPGEDMASFAAGFDRLWAAGPHEIQVGILKRLKGAPIARHSGAHAMRYSPLPPYDILATDCIGFEDMRRLTRFARYWDLVGNSGRFPRALALLLGDDPFARFLVFSDWLHSRSNQTHQIALDRLFDLVFEGMLELGIDPDVVRTALAADYAGSGARGNPAFLPDKLAEPAPKNARGNVAHRQMRHLG